MNFLPAGNQNSPAVAMDSGGKIAAVWAGPDADQNGIWGRVMVSSAKSSASVASRSGQETAIMAAAAAAVSSRTRLPDAALDGLLPSGGTAGRISATDLAIACWATDPRRARDTHRDDSLHDAQ